MIALADDFSSPKAETKQEADDEVASPNNPTLSSAVDLRRSPAERRSAAGNASGAISRLFWEAMRCLTRRAPAPEPKRRRKSDEAGRSLKAAAGALFRRLPWCPLFEIVNPDWDAFTWLRIWDYNDQADIHTYENCSVAEHQHGAGLSPRP